MLIVANWKAHKTSGETHDFLNVLYHQLRLTPLKNQEVIICPSFTSLAISASFIAQHKLPLKLGVQDVSEFDEGAYTGEISAKQVREFAEYTLIGHSERRAYFNEKIEQFEKKATQAHTAGLQVIFCAQNELDPIAQNTGIIAYEPPSAIGTGVPDDLANIERVFGALHLKTGQNSFLYGGSVDEENIEHFLRLPYLGGFLVGSASLDPYSFLKLLAKC